MTKVYIPLSVRKHVRRRANSRCEYCGSSEKITGIAYEIDHIMPVSLGGSSEFSNLCLACPHCNSRKWAKIDGFDHLTQEKVSLFHPREQNWHDHFKWYKDENELVGKTAIGRVTIATLELNHALMVGARSIWMQFGLHPPK